MSTIIADYVNSFLTEKDKKQSTTSTQSYSIVTPAFKGVTPSNQIENTFSEFYEKDFSTPLNELFAKTLETRIEVVESNVKGTKIRNELTKRIKDLRTNNGREIIEGLKIIFKNNFQVDDDGAELKIRELIKFSAIWAFTLDKKNFIQQKIYQRIFDIASNVYHNTRTKNNYVIQGLLPMWEKGVSTTKNSFNFYSVKNARCCDERKKELKELGANWYSENTGSTQNSQSRQYLRLLGFIDSTKGKVNDSFSLNPKAKNLMLMLLGKQ